MNSTAHLQSLSLPVLSASLLKALYPTKCSLSQLHHSRALCLVRRIKQQNEMCRQYFPQSSATKRKDIWQRLLNQPKDESMNRIPTPTPRSNRRKRKLERRYSALRLHHRRRGFRRSKRVGFPISRRSFVRQSRGSIRRGHKR